MTRSSATAIGFIAVLLWAMLAVFTAGSAPVPPLLLNTLTFAVGGTVGLIWVVARGKMSTLKAISFRIYLFGTLGLFGYHALYFSALRLAPPAEAGLIAYLWPLFIVLASGLLPGERLSLGHSVGALISFAGAAMIVLQNGASFDPETLPGLGLAFLCALTWTTYSVGSRFLGTTPTEAVAVFCCVTAILSLPLHLAFETAVWPDRIWGWISVLALGLGPVGLAFYVWDIGVKKGDIQLLGVASYAAPLLSTLVLIATGYAAASPSLLAAAGLITLGAAIAAWASHKAMVRIHTG